MCSKLYSLLYQFFERFLQILRLNCRKCLFLIIYFKYGYTKKKNTNYTWQYILLNISKNSTNLTKSVVVKIFQNILENVNKKIFKSISTETTFSELTACSNTIKNTTGIYICLIQWRVIFWKLGSIPKIRVLLLKNLHYCLF